jgi:hypothetical protein
MFSSTGAAIPFNYDTGTVVDTEEDAPPENQVNFSEIGRQYGIHDFDCFYDVETSMDISETKNNRIENTKKSSAKRQRRHSSSDDEKNDSFEITYKDADDDEINDNINSATSLPLPSLERTNTALKLREGIMKSESDFSQGSTLNSKRSTIKRNNESDNDFILSSSGSDSEEGNPASKPYVTSLIHSIYFSSYLCEILF